MPLRVHVITFFVLYNAAVLAGEDAKSPRSNFFPDLILRFAKVGKSKQSSFTRDLASTLMYEPTEGNTGTHAGGIKQWIRLNIFDVIPYCTGRRMWR